jgi:hypothetical protein
MTFPATTDTIIVSEPRGSDTHHAYVDIPAILAGIVLASAIALVMLAFGSAIGLSFANFHGGTGVSAVWIAIAAASWLLWVEISSFMAGGYIAGRLRRRVHDATEHESDVRDGAHGLLVWAGALIIGALLAFGGISATLSTIGNVASTATSAVATAAGPAAGAAASKSSFDPMAYLTDTLLRPSATATAPAGNPALSHDDTVAETGRILANGAISGSISDDDKAYLAQLVSRSTGLSADDAKKRVDSVLANIDAAKAKAADAAENARKTAVLAAFLAAASLLVAGAAAYWAAMMGGNHRDKQTEFDWFRRV